MLKLCIKHTTLIIESDVTKHNDSEIVYSQATVTDTNDQLSTRHIKQEFTNKLRKYKDMAMILQERECIHVYVHHDIAGA